MDVLRLGPADTRRPWGTLRKSPATEVLATKPLGKDSIWKPCHRCNRRKGSVKDIFSNLQADFVALADPQILRHRGTWSVNARADDRINEATHSHRSKEEGKPDNTVLPQGTAGLSFNISEGFNLGKAWETLPSQYKLGVCLCLGLCYLQHGKLSLHDFYLQTVLTVPSMQQLQCNNGSFWACKYSNTFRIPWWNLTTFRDPEQAAVHSWNWL